jgi:hypothetical protein
MQEIATELAGQASSAAAIERLVEQWFARDMTAGTQYLLSRGGQSVRVVAHRVERRSGGLICRDEQQREQLVTSYTELSPVDDVE